MFVLHYIVFIEKKQSLLFAVCRFAFDKFPKCTSKMLQATIGIAQQPIPAMPIDRVEGTTGERYCGRTRH
jgi:hypothetical protein